MPGVLVAKTPLWKDGSRFAFLQAGKAEDKGVSAGGAGEKCACED